MLPSCRDAEWQKRSFASTSFSSFKLYVNSNLGNAVLEVTKILYFGILNLNFSGRDSDPSQTSSRINNIGLGPI